MSVVPIPAVQPLADLRRCGGERLAGGPCRVILSRPGRERCASHGGRDLQSEERYSQGALGPDGSVGFVYFIGAPEDGPIKIGSTGNLTQRLGSIQSCSPVLLKLLASFSTDCRFGDERRYHRMFGDLRLHGEWFERDPALLACIEKINEGVWA